MSLYPGTSIEPRCRICGGAHETAAHESMFPYPQQPVVSPVLSPVMGCICPPGANKECENPACPRKPVKATG